MARILGFSEPYYSIFDLSKSFIELFLSSSEFHLRLQYTEKAISSDCKSLYVTIEADRFEEDSVMIRNVVFDIDGTLIDTEKAYMNALLDVANDQRHLDFTYDQVVAIYGIPGIAGLKQLGFTDAEVPKVLQAWYQAFAKYQDLVAVFPGIINTLKELQKYDVELGVVTSKTNDELAADFTPRGLTPFFRNIITSSDTKKHKPNPEPLLKMIEISEIPANETLYVGDTIFDLQSAKGAGAKFGVAGWGAHNHGQFGDMDYYFSRPAEIIDVIR